jgi:hypothetical protein
MDSSEVVLIDQTGTVSLEQMQGFVEALQQQVDQDLAPYWDVRADISSLGAADAVPAGKWPIRIVNVVSEGYGVHSNDQGQPYAEVLNNNLLSSTLSHELLEMLVNPMGNRMKQAANLDTQSAETQVCYLVEVCDPCEMSSYPIAGVAVSNFILPSFYEQSATGRVDFLGKLAGPLPLALPAGCYISWWDPVEKYWFEYRDGVITLGAGADRLNRRAERDALAPPSRHDLAAIYRTWPEEVERLPRPSQPYPPSTGP